MAMAGVQEPDGGGSTTATVTRLLNEAGSGDPEAAAALLPLVYDRLRELAGRKMRQERPDQTLQATALVHEAYLRLVGEVGMGDAAAGAWDGRWHFFSAAAEAMRRILVEQARRRSRLKRGGALRRVGMDEALDGARVTLNEPPDELLELDDALDRLAEAHPEKAKLVKLRYFAGLTVEEAARAMGMSGATVDRHWAFAKAWLYRRLTTGGADQGGAP
jgi:RNA polymerase sigma factor (TIGR02999 family)